MTTLPFRNPTRLREAFKEADPQPTAETPVRALSGVELATVTIVVDRSARPSPTATDFCSVIAFRLHNWEATNIDPGRFSTRTGWGLAAWVAANAAPNHQYPLDVWLGWDALRMVDARPDLGLAVWLSPDPDSIRDVTPRVRLTERLAAVEQ